MGGIEPVVLQAGSFRLRLATEADGKAALEMSIDPAILQWYSTGVVDVESAKRWLSNSADWSEGQHATWVVTDISDRLVGNVSVVGIDRIHQRSAQVAYRTAPWARNRGAASSALRAATDWAFRVLGLERLELSHAVDNPASCIVAQRVGYLLEGLQRLGYRDDAGKRWDCHLHARLSSDPPPPGSTHDPSGAHRRPAPPDDESSLR